MDERDRDCCQSGDQDRDHQDPAAAVAIAKKAEDDRCKDAPAPGDAEKGVGVFEIDSPFLHQVKWKNIEYPGTGYTGDDPEITQDPDRPFSEEVDIFLPFLGRRFHRFNSDLPEEEGEKERGCAQEEQEVPP